jgi:hypothetical protein
VSVARHARTTLLAAVAGAMIVAATAVGVPAHAANAQNARPPGLGRIHFMPRRGLTGQAGPFITANLTYQGGPVMQAGTSAIPIFWEPAHLQAGLAVSVSAQYNTLIRRFFTDFGGHASYNIVTQYYQTTHGPTQQIVNSSRLIKGIVDTSAYPAAAGSCANHGIKNCVNDAQIEAEVQKVITAGNLPTGLNTYYPVFTDPREESCTPSGCFAPVTYPTNPGVWKYCAYHSVFGTLAHPIVYANMPYAHSNLASIGGCNGGASHPNDAAFDDEGSSMSHEFIESITDPELNAWYDLGTGNEISDICNQFVDQVTYASHPYVIQQQWSNELAMCLPGGDQQVRLNPAAGAAGSSTTVSGTGFGISETIHLSFSDAHGTVTSLGTTTSDGSGGFSTPAAIPAGAVAGTGTLEADGASFDDGAAARFAVPLHQADELIAPTQGGPFRGNDIYNLTGLNQTVVRSIARGHVATSWVQIQNDGNVPDTFSLKGSRTVGGFTIAYKMGTADVTPGVFAGSYEHALAPGASFMLQVIVGVRLATAAGRTFNPKVTATSVGDPTKKDAVVATAKAT